MPATDEATGRVLTGSGILIGEEAHIRSLKADGPRHESGYGGFDSYENLVLLCPTHHTLVDKNGGEDYPVEALERMKAEHEAWVRSRLSTEGAEELNLQVLVAAGVQHLEDLLFDRWPLLYWQLDQAIPFLGQGHFDALVEAGLFLLAKDWPVEFPQIASASERLRHLISLFGELVHEAFEWEEGRDALRLDRPETRLDRWDPPLHAELFHKTQVNMVATWWLVDTLTFELNDFIRAVRHEVDRTYRFVEGVLLVPVGDGIVRPVRHTRIEYPRDRNSPALPTSLDALREAIGRVASERGVEPQSLHPSTIRFP